jgi:hypothetical protein
METQDQELTASYGESKDISGEWKAEFVGGDAEIESK